MFDTLRYAQKLEAVGLSRKQAEAHVQIIAEIIEDDVATKQDLKDLEHRLLIKIGAMVCTIVSLAIAIVAVLEKSHF